MAAVLTTKQAARYVGLGLNAFRAAVARGDIARVEDGGWPRFRPVDLDAYLERKRVPARWEQQRGRPEKQAQVIQLPTGINPVTKAPYRATAPRADERGKKEARSV